MPKFVRWIFPRRIWAFSSKTPNIYLTFDDGPIPEVTPWVLDVLKEHKAKATFFCIGDNIKNHATIYRRILAEGHAIGNHTFYHVKGNETPLQKYIDDVASCKNEMLKQVQHDPKHNYKLFRPLYGRVTSAQAKQINKEGYQIVMWDVLSADFDVTISEEKCLQNVLQNIQKGSIVVFHDSLKSEEKLKYVLPKVLDYIGKNGWDCCGIP